MTGFGKETPSLHGRSLDWLNFFLADVKGGLGPYLGIYLLTQQHWNQAAIGLVATVAGIAGIVSHAPVGASFMRRAGSAGLSSPASPCSVSVPWQLLQRRFFRSFLGRRRR